MQTLSDPSVVVNNEPIAIVPNSVKYTEGAGEQKMRAASTGGGNATQVYSDDVETNFSMVAFAIFNTPEFINLARTWKKNRNQNVVVISGKTANGDKLRRTFNQAAILNDYEVNLGSDTTVELEFQSNPAV